MTSANNPKVLARATFAKYGRHGITSDPKPNTLKFRLCWSHELKFPIKERPHFGSMSQIEELVKAQNQRYEMFGFRYWYEIVGSVGRKQ